VNVPVPPPPVLKPVTLNVPPVLFVKVAVPFECVPPVTRMSAVIGKLRYVVAEIVVADTPPVNVAPVRLAFVVMMC
jgi:hypothetical protein